ncbi:MAG TPA: hypothetical protein VHJ20_09240 [Polyangia bacterium]|nr:hypothetical protein [Polyangia bacterium]
MAVKAGAVCALMLTLAAARASAHQELSALGTNRYVTAALVDGRVDVTDTQLEGLLTGGADRRRFDTDGDGHISGAELAAARVRLATEGAAVEPAVDDRALAAPLDVSIELGGADDAADAPVVIERRQSFANALHPGLNRLRLTITREPERVLDTELAVMLTPGLVLRDGTDLVAFRGPRASMFETRAATFVLELPPPPRSGRVTLAIVAAALAITASVAGIAWRRRQRRGIDARM